MFFVSFFLVFRLHVSKYFSITPSFVNVSMNPAPSDVFLTLSFCFQATGHESIHKVFSLKSFMQTLLYTFTVDNRLLFCVLRP